MSSFDYVGYISKYAEGHPRVNRLLAIANTIPEIEVDVLHEAINEVKKFNNAEMYEQIVEILNKKGHAVEPDKAWIARAIENTKIEVDTLDAQLQMQKSDISKEGIRRSYMAIGEYHSQHANYSLALKAFIKCRDYCTTSALLAELCLSVIKASLALENYSNANTYLNKAEQTKEMDKDNELGWKLRACNGIYNLTQGNYRTAAQSFLKCKINIGLSFIDVIHPIDIAIYGTLCALASFDRNTLKREVLNNVSFNEFLNLMPQLRVITNAICSSNYPVCFQALDELSLGFKVDYYLRKHYDKLMVDIKSKAMTQYFSAYVKVNLAVMSSSFSIPLNDLERDVAELIMDGKIQARIDSQHKILISKKDEERKVSFKNVLKVGDQYINEMRNTLLRVSLAQNDIFVSEDNGKGKKDRDYMRGGGAMMGMDSF